MEFAVWPESFRDGKPRKLMTPSKQEGVFMLTYIFGNARWRIWHWSAILDVGIHC